MFKKILVGFALASLTFSTALASGLKCRVTQLSLAKHQATHAKKHRVATDVAVKNWQACYALALKEASKYEYADEDFYIEGHLGDLFDGDGDVRFAGYIYNYTQWTVNDSLAGYWYGTSGLVNVYSPESPSKGDQRLTEDGKSFLR